MSDDFDNLSQASNTKDVNDGDNSKRAFVLWATCRVSGSGGFRTREIPVVPQALKVLALYE